MEEIFITQDYGGYPVNCSGYLVKSIITGSYILGNSCYLATTPPDHWSKYHSWPIGYRSDLIKHIPKCLQLQHFFIWISKARININD